MSADCIFCKIARGELPSAPVLETDDVIAFLDIAPVNLGHLLIVPRRHHENVLELSSDEAARIGALLPRLCKAVQQVSGADGFHVIINNGQAAGQTVFHGHWHVIPRFLGDAVHWPWPHQKYPSGAMTELQRKIIDAIPPA